jgi:glycosyltransferase involved in cell wall biosynthesis
MVASREGGRQLRLRRQRNAPAGTVRPTRAPCSPLVTIITAVFNGEDVLEATIQSVITQSSQDFEYLIMDGGSADGTLDILRRYDDALDYWSSEGDEGIYDAFNKGVRLAGGEWILFLGAGDLLFDRETIQRAAAGLKSAGSDIQAAYGRVVRLHADGRFVEEENEPWAAVCDKWRGGRRVMPQHQGIFERRRFLADHVFDVKYRIVADYKSFAQAIASNPPLYLDCLIARVTVGGVSSAPRDSLSACLEILKLNRELGRGLDHLPHQLFFALKSAVKTFLSIVLPIRGAMKIVDVYRKLTGRRKMWT